MWVLVHGVLVNTHVCARGVCCSSGAIRNRVPLEPGACWLGRLHGHRALGTYLPVYLTSVGSARVHHQTQFSRWGGNQTRVLMLGKHFTLWPFLHLWVQQFSILSSFLLNVILFWFLLSNRFSCLDSVGLQLVPPPRSNSNSTLTPELYIIDKHYHSQLKFLCKLYLDDRFV